MMTEGAAVTDVVDAFDLGSLWSFRFTAGYYRSTRNATLQRERSVITAPAGSTVSQTGTTEFDNLARYEEVTQTLNVGAELAVYHDFSLTIGVPIILSNTRRFSTDPNVSSTDSMRILADYYSVNGVDTHLFDLPFQSPERSGIDQIYLGFNWDILNQARDPHSVTWVFRFQWRPPVGSPLRPCYVAPATGQTVCPLTLYEDAAMHGGHAARPDTYDNNNDYMNGNNVSDPTGLYQRPTQMSPDPGISRRVHGLFAETIASRKFGYVEPYVGLHFLLEVPEGDTQTFRFGDAPYGQLATYPPIQGWFTVGTEITPWENRESWQRFSVDLRVIGRYYSQGRDYSPLFDALGSSNSIPLTTANYAINDYNNTNRPIYFTGTTGVQSHASIAGMMGVSIQPARFLRFAFGGSVMYTAPFLLTATDACNPNQVPDNPAFRGGCVGDSVPDPQHRPVIDAAGQRFRLVDDITWDVYFNVYLTPRF